MFNKKKEDKMKAKDVITQMTSGDTFYITYYAKKHQAIITRKGTWTKPNTDTQGKHFVSKEGNDIFVYWDLDATPNDKGSQWRKATNPMRVRL